MKPVFHITTEAEWARAKEQGSYRPASFDREGFIHLSEREQVLKTANRFFKGKSGLVLLEIDRELLGAALKYEEGEPGETFPHLYSELPVAAVRTVTPLIAGDDGTFPSGSL